MHPPSEHDELHDDLHDELHDDLHGLHAFVVVALADEVDAVVQLAAQHELEPKNSPEAPKPKNGVHSSFFHW